jgi:H+/Cl- antiporter ClcA
MNVDVRNGREKIMNNIVNGLIVVLVSFLVGTFICGVAYLIEKILIWDIFLSEIPDGNKKVFADAIIHIIVYLIWFATLYYVYLNEYTMYIVEDLSGSDVDKYHYEINILPQQLQNFVLTYNP